MKDEQTLSEYKIEDKQTVHLVKGKSAAASGQPAASSTGSQPTSSSGASGAGTTGA